ncbi:MAG: hypothetical protein QOK25_1122 [Thermoleophilaceae bacterium]|nr:hypothetical protein [Thermoleophilaceae bacterium]
MAWARRALPNALVAGALALLIFAWFGHAFLNYDTFYALVWGNDLVHGRAPQYDVPVAPTPHPLATAVGALVSPLGDGAEAALLALVLFSIGWLLVGLYRLGRASFAWPVGVLAAAIFATRVPPLNFGIRGYVDLPAIAFVVWAALLEVRRPRRGWPVFALLGLAGLLRPEAWLFLAAYWLWLFPACDWPARLRYAALALAAPVIWAVSDLLVTGDALWSLHGTHDLAGQLKRPTGIANVPKLMPRRLGEIMRLPELVASVIGFAAALVWLRARARVPAAVAVLNGIAYLVLGIVGLSLLGRYLFLAAAMLSLFAAVAVFGWAALPRGRPLRLAWRMGGLVVFAAILVFSPMQADRLNSLRNDIANRARVQADLHDLVKSRAGEAALGSCGTLYVPNHRPVPELAYWTGRRPADIVSAQGLQKPVANGLFVAPATPAVAKLSVLDPRDLTRPATPPPGYRQLARNRSWVLYGGCRAKLAQAGGRYG